MPFTAMAISISATFSSSSSSAFSSTAASSASSSSSSSSSSVIVSSVSRKGRLNRRTDAVFGLLGLGCLLLTAATFPTPISGLDPDVVSHCCELGRDWAVQSQDVCGPYPAESSYIGAMQLYAGPDETVACTALVDTCCVLTRREKQCTAGKETAVILNRCDGLHLYQANEDAKECCNCCQLGLIISQIGQACDVPVQLSRSVPCFEAFTECCLGQTPESVPTVPPLQQPGGGDGFLYARTSHPVLPRQTQQSVRHLQPTSTTASSFDFDECSEFEGELCAHICTNTIDSYYCSCRQGFQLQSDGKSCHLASGVSETAETTGDECRSGRHTCTSEQICVQTRGGFLCQPGGVPVAVPGTSTSTSSSSSIAPSSSTSPSPVPTTLPSTRCRPGYAWNRITHQCEDIDECIIELHNCETGQSCVNTEGHFQCLSEVDDPDIYDDYYPETESPSDADFSQHQTASERPATTTPLMRTSTPTTKRILTAPNRRPLPNRLTVRPRVVVTHRLPAAATTDSMVTNRTVTVRRNGDEDGIQCLSGYTLDPRIRLCVDVDECEEDIHDCRLPNQICVNGIGSFRCDCDQGYEFNDLTRFCEDIDECAIDESVCPGGQICENTLGSFQCSCATGFHFDSSTQLCTDVDECQVTPSVCSTTESCENVLGSYRCSRKTLACGPGYKTNPSGTRCLDVDECAVASVCARGQICGNTVGSYKCSCAFGFILDPETDQCADIDECEEDSNVCNGWEICENLIGSYRCTRRTCERGYQLHSSATHCIDIDECAIDESVCPGRQICENTLGSFKCSCATGFHFDSSTQLCADIDECQVTPNVCTATESCENVVGSYRCSRKALSCGPGYKTNPTGTRCIDVDECAVDEGVCLGSQKRCINTVGSYICNCQSGYRLNTTTNQCVDVDECQLRQYTCFRGQKCVNTPGSFECRCESGFALDQRSKTCTDVNECERRPGVCEANETCENTVGSFRCVPKTVTCSPGYMPSPSGLHCIDVDECRTLTHNCGAGHVCQNTPGSFRCLLKQCPRGQRLDHETGQCNDVVCARGMRPDQTGICIDINECAERPSVCRPHQECQNTVGSFQCHNALTCGAGYELNDDTGRCDDVDECQRGTHRCHGSHVQCVNRPGSYTCQCPEGFQLDHSRQSCEDINECRLYDGQTCSQNADCENTPGSFRCICREGFEITEDGRTCRDIDECLQPRLCQHNCKNTWGSYQCSCNAGYNLGSDARSCTDIDECTVWSQRGTLLCQGVCENTPGSYRCSCPSGYQLGTDGRVCRDVDECAGSNPSCSGPDDVCINTRGGFKCEMISCPKGFTKVSNSNRNSHAIRCQRKTFTCPQGDSECLYAPLSYSVNFIAVPGKLIRVPTDLFTMRGPVASSRRLQFELQVISARDPRTGAVRANRAYFNLNQMKPNEVIVQLIHEIHGAQDIQLQLNMNVYSKEFRNNAEEVFYGTAVAKIFIYITEDPW